jgi:prepilin-type N-terminal cleavage/methylation domain-containing protein
MKRLARAMQSVFARRPIGRAARAQAGFTLIELLVVLVILGLLAAFAAPQVLKYLGRAKTDAARAAAREPHRCWTSLWSCLAS